MVEWLTNTAVRLGTCSYLDGMAASHVGDVVEQRLDIQTPSSEVFIEMAIFSVLAEGLLDSHQDVLSQVNDFLLINFILIEVDWRSLEFKACFLDHVDECRLSSGIV